MAGGWQGDGTFVRSDGTYEGTTVYQQEDAADVHILASNLDASENVLATGIAACLAKNGENAATANLNLGSFRYTAAGRATARTDLIPLYQVQDGAVQWAHISAAAASSNMAYTGTLVPAITSYLEGMYVNCESTSGTANVGAGATLNLNGVGATAVRVLCGGSTKALEGNEIPAGHRCQFVYDGTYWILINPPYPTLANNINNGIKSLNAAGTSLLSILYADANNDTVINSGSSDYVAVAANGTPHLYMLSGSILPATDAVGDLGSTSYHFSATHTLELNAGDTGVLNVNAASIHLNEAGTKRWIMDSTYLYPNTTKGCDIGKSTNLVSTVNAIELNTQGNVMTLSGSALLAIANGVEALRVTNVSNYGYLDFRNSVTQINKSASGGAYLTGDFLGVRVDGSLRYIPIYTTVS